MRTTKTTPKVWMLSLLSALFMLSGLTACDSTEDSVDDSSKPKPEVPISDDDWQVVPATGGTITKDSISIIFPSGTFSKETKVAITEVKKGEIGGEYEASKFYQITMPCTASKPLSFKVKNSERNDDINFVALANAFNLCKGEEKKVELHYDTKYSNGEYSATIPAINGDVEDDNIYFTVGLGRFTNSDSNKTRGLILPYETLLEGKVKNVSYIIRYRWTTLDDWASHIWGQGTLNKVVEMSGRIDNYVQEALTKIQDLGFKPKGEKVLYVDFDPSEKDDWGGFQVCGVPGEGGWSMWVGLGINKLLNPITTEEDIRCTVVHEIFHWFQYFFDPRSNYKKSKKSHGGEEGVLYEMGGVWAEHLLNDERLNTNYLFSEVMSGEIFQDKMGLTDYFDRLPRIGGKTDNDIRGQQGYSMGPLLYYLCSTNALKVFGIGNDKVLELHEQWGKSFVSTLFAGSSLVKPTIEILDHWAFGTHNCGIFSGCQIDNYYLNLLSGKVLKDISIFTHYDFLNAKTLKNTDKEKLVDTNFDKIPFEGTVYPYGYAFRSIQFKGLKGQIMKEKKLVIKQEKEGVQTYLLTANRTDKKFERIGTVAKGQDSIVVSGSKLESYRKADGTFDQYFFFVTTRTSNSTSDTGAKPWEVTVEIMDAKKEEDKFEPRTDITSVDIHWRSSTTGGNWANEENNKFQYNNMLDTGRDNPIQVSKSGNTISVSGKKKRSSIGVFDCDIEYSFTINYTSKGYGEITDLSLSGSGNAKIGNETISLYDLSLAASHIGYESQSKRTTSESVTWGSTEAEGLKISKFTMKYDSGGNAPTSLTYQSDPTNNVWIKIDFGE